jgi:hypothetical protein
MPEPFGVVGHTGDPLGKLALPAVVAGVRRSAVARMGGARAVSRVLRAAFPPAARSTADAFAGLATDQVDWLALDEADKRRTETRFAAAAARSPRCCCDRPLLMAAGSEELRCLKCGLLPSSPAARRSRAPAWHLRWAMDGGLVARNLVELGPPSSQASRPGIDPAADAETPQ